jgi:hypothetical protein
LVGLFGFDGVRDLQVQVPESQGQGLLGDCQEASHLISIPMRILQDESPQDPVSLAARFRMHVASNGPQPLADERLQAESFSRRWPSC